MSCECVHSLDVREETRRVSSSRHGIAVLHLHRWHRNKAEFTRDSQVTSDVTTWHGPQYLDFAKSNRIMLVFTNLFRG